MVVMRQARWLLCACALAVFFGSLGSSQTTKPDLIVKDVEVSPLNARAQDTLTIRAVIANTGRTQVSDRIDVVIKVDDVRIVSTRVQLPARQERAVEASWEAVEGDHTLTIEVDLPRDQVDEKDERNNRYALDFRVAPLSNVVSYTQTALLAQAIALKQVSAALVFNTTSTNLLLLLDLIKQGFDDFSKAGKALVASMQAISQAWPTAFAEADVFTPLLPYYVAINEAASVIQASLDALDLPAALAAMAQVEDALRALAQLNGPTLPLAALAQAADKLHLAIEAGSQAQERFSDSSKGSVDESVLTLIDEVAAFAQVLATVGQALDQSAQANTAQFVDAQGQLVRQLSGAVEVSISTSGTSIAFELVNASGSAVLTLSADNNALSWKGTDAQGQPLAAQTYFYQVSWLNDGVLLTDVGTLAIGN